MRSALPSLILLFLAFFVRFVLPEAVDRLEMWWLDSTLQLRVKLGLSQPLPEQIRIVQIDEQDFEALGPTDEYEMAGQAIQALADMGSQVIAIDVIFRRGSGEQQRQLADTITQILEETETRVVLAAEHQGQRGTLPEMWVTSFPKVDRQFPWAGVNMDIDLDRIWRRYSLTRFDGAQTHPSLALATFQDSLEETGTDGQLKWLQLSEDFTQALEFKADDTPRFINFRHSFFSTELDQQADIGRRIWNLRDILELAADSDSTSTNSPFKGATVFFGYGSGVDEKATSMGPLEPGIFLHALAFGDLVEDRLLKRASPSLDLLILILTGLVALGCFRIKRFSLFLLLGIVGIAIILSASLWSVWRLHLIPQTVLPGLLWAGLFIIETGRRYFVELKARLLLDGTMSYYFSPKVKDHVLNHPGSMDPKGALLSILITDIRNFTTLCEIISPEAMIQIMSRAYEAQTTAVMEQDGNLQHFLGDQFTAYWGAPEEQPDGADRAYRATVKLIELMEELKAQLKTEIDPDAASLFDYGVGLNHARGLVGNIGSSQYLDYNIFGDVVNSAARIESLTKYYEVKVLTTRSFLDGLKSPPVFRVVDFVQVKGKTVGMEVIELDSPMTRDDFPDLCQRYQIALTLYCDAEFAKAEDLFRLIGEEFDDTPSRKLAQRCKELILDPPDDWDGVFVPRFK